MILLYTGALAPNQPQPQASQSLGGLISSSTLQNGTINNIFPDISKQALEGGQIYTRLIAIQNTGVAAVTGVSIYTEYTSDLFEVKSAGVLPVIDTTCNKTYFEQLLNSNSLPFQAVLTVHDSITPIIVGTIDPGAIIGVWLSLNRKSSTPTPPLDPSSDEYVTALKNATRFIETAFEMKINYT